jgi:hypothetical protein
MINQDYLKEILHYNPETGVFIWIKKPSKNRPANSIAGTLNAGYIVITLHGKHYYAHRLAWLYMTGEWPEKIIDHKNKSGIDNRFSNLRSASYSQNSLNKLPSKNNLLGVKGVTYQKEKRKFEARAVLNNKHNHLGYFDDIESASAAYHAFAKEHHGEFYSGI